MGPPSKYVYNEANTVMDADVLGLVLDGRFADEIEQEGTSKSLPHQLLTRELRNKSK